MTTHNDLEHDVKSKMQELGQDAKAAVRSEAEKATATARHHVADQATAAASAAGAAADEFDPNSLQARAAQQAADQIEGLAHRLRTTDLQEVTRDVSTFARNNPVLFIGGAALLGFAASRFLKARNPQRVAHAATVSDPWSANPAHHADTGGYDVPS